MWGWEWPPSKGLGRGGAVSPVSLSLTKEPQMAFEQDSAKQKQLC